MGNADKNTDFFLMPTSNMINAKDQNQYLSKQQDKKN
jgi:hypothetical protein